MKYSAPFLFTEASYERPCGKFFIAHAPIEAENFQSLPPELAKKYTEKFKFPERFIRAGEDIVAVPFKPAKADKER